MQTETKEPFTVPTFGIANTDPLDMAHADFYSWLECFDLSEEERQQWENRYRYQFPKPAQPLEGAKLLDLRHCAFTLELFERIENPEKHGEMITGEKYASCTITGAENPKPKKNKNKTILFALPIT